jgi:hypothetical protein
VREQRVRDLRDRENEYQVEKQFGVGDAAVLVRRVHPIQRAAMLVCRHRPAPGPD